MICEGKAPRDVSLSNLQQKGGLTDTCSNSQTSDSPVRGSDTTEEDVSIQPGMRWSEDKYMLSTLSNVP